VMAHEIAHVAARHGTKQATRGELINIASIPLIFMGGWTGYAIRQGAGLAIPMGFLTFSRSFEREADDLGLQYLYKSGYDPTSFVDFFEKIGSLERKKPGSLAKVFSTHPMTDDRIKNAQNQIQKTLVAKPEYVVTTESQVGARDVVSIGDRQLQRRHVSHRERRQQRTGQWNRRWRFRARLAVRIQPESSAESRTRGLRQRANIFDRGRVRRREGKLIVFRTAGDRAGRKVGGRQAGADRTSTRSM